MIFKSSLVHNASEMLSRTRKGRYVHGCGSEAWELWFKNRWTEINTESYWWHWNRVVIDLMQLFPRITSLFVKLCQCCCCQVSKHLQDVTSNLGIGLFAAHLRRQWELSGLPVASLLERLVCTWSLQHWSVGEVSWPGSPWKKDSLPRYRECNWKMTSSYQLFLGQPQLQRFRPPVSPQPMI